MELVCSLDPPLGQVEIEDTFGTAHHDRQTVGRQGAVTKIGLVRIEK